MPFTARAEAPTSAEPAHASAPSLLVERKALEQAIATLTARLPAPIAALELSIHPDHVVLQAQDPANAERVVQYEYRAGGVTGPIEVELRGPGQLSDNLFPLARADLGSVPAFAARAVEKVSPKRGRARYVVLRRNLPVTFDVHFRAYVTSPERDAQIDGDERGRLVDSS